MDARFVPDCIYPMGAEIDTESQFPIYQILCGQQRPGHFSGVATVVTKLLVTCKPDFALPDKKIISNTS